jgi:GTP-binding protein HflX
MLKEAISQRLRRKKQCLTIQLAPSQGRQRAKLFELGAVTEEEPVESGGWTLQLKMSEKDLRRFLKRENLAIEQLEPVVTDTSVSAANE